MNLQSRMLSDPKRPIASSSFISNEKRMLACPNKHPFFESDRGREPMGCRHSCTTQQYRLMLRTKSRKEANKSRSYKPGQVQSAFRTKE